MKIIYLEQTIGVVN